MTEKLQKKNEKSLFLSKKSLEQLQNGYKKFKKIIEQAKEKGLNESDTSNILNDILGEMFGYDKYFDVTTEYKIKGQYCDYGVKINNIIQFLIEVKSISIDLNDNHIFQAASYAGNEGVKRVLLTNLRQWQLFYLSFGQKIEKDLILDIDFGGIDKNKIIEFLQYFHKEALQKKFLDKLLKQKIALSDKNVKKILLSDNIIKKLRSEIKTVTGMKITDDETRTLLQQYFK